MGERFLIWLYNKKDFFITHLGGKWNNSSKTGTFYWNLNNATSNRNRNISSHLVNANKCEISSPCHLAKYKNTILNYISKFEKSKGESLVYSLHTKRKFRFMKRYGNLYEQICDIDNLKLAHKNAQKGKGWYQEVKMVNSNPDYYLGILQDMLINKTYKTSEYETFMKNDTGKVRKIYKLPYFPDRICQWAILQVIEPILLKNFIADTYSAIPGRGIHKALERVDKAIQNDVVGTQYCLKLDAKKYYPSINHDILKNKYRRLFKDKDLIWLLDEIIDSTPGDTGIPIGNYISQYSGNFYFSEFDHWIKESKHVKYYFRYMDDIVILGKSKEELHQLRKEIDVYFKTKLKLKIKENWQVFPTFVRGIDFVGYRTFLNYKLLRKNTCKNFKVKMNKIKKKIKNGNQMNYSEWCSIHSYQGWLVHCDSYRLNQKYIKPLEFHANQYYLQNIKRKGEVK